MNKINTFVASRGGTLLILACALWALAFIINNAVSEISHYRRARRQRCRPPPRVSAGFPFGIPAVLRMLRADREHKFPQSLAESEKEWQRQRRGKKVLTVETRILGQRRILTNDPENVRAILASQFKDFGLGKDRNNNLAILQGFGVFSSDGLIWEHSRAMLRPQFARDQISDLSLQELHVGNMIKTLETKVNVDGWTNPFDIQQIFFRFTMDSATEFLFGKSIDSQLLYLKPAGLSFGAGFDEENFIRAFDSSLDHVTRGFRLGKFYWLAHTSECRKVCKTVHDFVDMYVQMGLRRHALLREEKHNLSTDDKKTEKERYVLLDAIVDEIADPVEIRNQLLNILIAGRDTTASLMGWLVLLLCRHPEEYAKLRAEVLSSFGTYSNPLNLTYSGLRSCTYLQYSLNETLRLFSVAPINYRKCLVRHSTLPRGGGPDGNDPIYIRQGDDVVYSTYSMHRSEEFWGPDANDFRPSRWKGLKPGWQFIPFNGGPRICIGQQFAITQSSYAMIRLLQRFEDMKGIDLPPKGEELHHLTVTDAPASGVNVQLKLVKE